MHIQSQPMQIPPVTHKMAKSGFITETSAVGTAILGTNFISGNRDINYLVPCTSGLTTVRIPSYELALAPTTSTAL